MPTSCGNGVLTNVATHFKTSLDVKEERTFGILSGFCDDSALSHCANAT